MIRSFHEEDAPEVMALWGAIFPDDPVWNDPATVIRRKLQVQRELFLVGEFAGRVVATVLGGYDGHRGWVYHLAVAAKERRKGFGRAMMNGVEERLRALGCPKINLQVRANNGAAVQFYAALGYAIEDRVSLGKRVE